MIMPEQDKTCWRLFLLQRNVNVQTFGKLWSSFVDGQVYAQTLYVPNIAIPGKGVHNVIYVATEHDSVYAFDADSNSGEDATPLWQVSFIDPSNGITTISVNDVNCYDAVAPEIRHYQHSGHRYQYKYDLRFGGDKRKR